MLDIWVRYFTHYPDTADPDIDSDFLNLYPVADPDMENDFWNPIPRGYSAEDLARLEQTTYQDDGITYTICLDEIIHASFITQLRCGHVYHPQCIRESLLLDKRCPQCRSEAFGELPQFQSSKIKIDGRLKEL